MIIDGIDYLFHYTSIEKLALILRNKTIRLNALCNMDDRQEGKAKDLSNLGRFFFVSCWTNEVRESIPLWRMYSKDDSGVRIALPKNPFMRHPTKPEDLKKVFHMPVDGEEEIDSFLNLAELMGNGCYSLQAWGGEILIEVSYTDDKDLLEPQVSSISGDQIQLTLGSMGKYKNTHWEFQKEWRYMMMFVPFSTSSNLELMNAQFSVMVNRMAMDSLEAPFEYFDLDLRDDALHQMRITPSPNMTEGNRELLDALLRKYDYGISVDKSELQGLI